MGVLMRKITSFQMTAIMICCLFARMMTYVPKSDDNAVLLIFSKLIACAFQWIMILPVLIFYKKSKGEGILQAYYSKNKPSGIIVTVLYLIVCFMELFLSYGNFTFFLQYSFLEYYSAWIILLVLAAVSVYVASMGLSSCARTAAIVTVATIAGIIVLLAGFEGNFEFRLLNIAQENKGGFIMRNVRDANSRAEEFVFFILLLPYLKEKPMRTVNIYIAVKFLISALIIASVSIILGDFALSTKIPFFSLSSYSKTALIERFDALLLMFWTLCAIIKHAVIILCIIECMKKLLPKAHKQTFGAASAAVCAAAAVVPLSYGKWDTHFFENYEYILIILLTAVIPLIALLTGKFRKSDETENKR